LSLAALWYFQDRIGRAPFATAALFIAMIFPALSFFDVYPMRFSFVADHFQYHASMPFEAFIVGGVTVLLYRKFGERAQSIGIAIAAVVVIVFIALIWRRLRDYEDNWTIWTDTINKNPQCWVAYNNRADMRIKMSDLAGAVEDYQKALEIYPAYAMAHANLGAMLFRQGDAQGAMAHTAEALRLRPDLAQAHLNMGKMLVRTGNPIKGFEHFAEAVRLQPGYADAHLTWGELLAERGQYDAAIQHFDAALRLNHDFVEAHNARGEALQAKGQRDLAEEEFKEALRIDPDYAPAKRNLQGSSF
jgi:tetratricopeptide (TPR) repeat protein